MMSKSYCPKCGHEFEGTGKWACCDLQAIGVDLPDCPNCGDLDWILGVTKLEPIGIKDGESP